MLFSDASDKECASYIGLVVVRQKNEHHIIEYDEEKSSFGIGYYLSGYYSLSKRIVLLIFISTYLF